jgi:hypothetical protein
MEPSANSNQCLVCRRRLTNRQTQGSSEQVAEEFAFQPAKRGDCIKPGVERSETPGSFEQQGTAREVGDSRMRRSQRLRYRTPGLEKVTAPIRLTAPLDQRFLVGQSSGTTEDHES